MIMKKIKRFENRYEEKEAQKLREALPSLDLTHIIKERYPSLQDALKDLDDALCLIFLFASLPTH